MRKMSSHISGRTKLRRARWPMPVSVKRALTEHDLVEAYRRRPPYQRNDYLGWIARAKLPATWQKRLVQMLDELRAGNRYMGMAWHGNTRKR